MSSSPFQLKITTAIAVIAAAVAVPHVKADEVSDFYKGKRLTIKVGFSPGGGYDTTARLFAKHVGKYIPGNPSVIVQNAPGAGSLKLTNALYNSAPKDGLEIALISSAVLMIPLYGKRKVKFVTSKFNLIGNLHRDAVACGVWKGAGQGIKTLPDLVAANSPVVFGSSRPTSPLSTFPMFMKNVLGANVKVVHGYRGSKPISLALQRGELDGACIFYESSVRGPYFNLLKSGNLDLFVQLAENSKAKIFGNATPIFSKLKSEEQKKMARLLFTPQEITRPILAPPGTPKARVAALRRALMNTMKDPGLISDAQKQFKMALKPMSGEELTQRFEDYYRTSPELVEKTYKLTTAKKNPRKKTK